eukprot:6462672-Amphidinium_carterae.1
MHPCASAVCLEVQYPVHALSTSTINSLCAASSDLCDKQNEHLRISAKLDRRKLPISNKWDK